MTKWTEKLEKLTDRQKWLRLPETLAHRLEAFSPELAKRLLSYASRAVQPELLATLFSLEEWSDTRVGLKVQPSGTTAGNLVTLSEFMVRVLLGRHLPLPEAGLQVRHVEAQLDTVFNQPLGLRLEVTANEREAWLTDLFRQGSSERELVIRLWSPREQRQGEITLKVCLHHTPALPAPPARDNT